MATLAFEYASDPDGSRQRGLRLPEPVDTDVVPSEGDVVVVEGCSLRVVCVFFDFSTGEAEVTVRLR